MLSAGNMGLLGQLSYAYTLQQLHHHLVLDDVHPATGDMADTLSINECQ